MKTYVSFDEYGNITARSTTPQDGWLEVPQDSASTPSTAHAVDGEVVLYTPEERAAKQNQPSRSHRWDNTLMAWVDTRDLAQIKADRWEAIKAARAAAEFGTFVWDGSTFDADDVSQRRIQGAAQLAMLAAAAEQPFEIDWTLTDNTVRTLSGADMIAVGMAMGMHVVAQHAIARSLRATIESEATTTPAEVEAVQWT